MNPWRSVAVLAVTLLLAAGAAEAGKKKHKARPDELFNPLLGIEYSHWLVGAVSQIATEDEIDEYLGLTSDEAAAAFIESFWAHRAEGVGIFEKKPRQIYEERVAESERRFAEGARPGNATDRGAVFIVFGEPETIEFETPTKLGDPTLEVWRYPADAPPGLGGEPPKTQYRFVEIDGQTVLYTGQSLRRRPESRPDRF